MIEPRTFTLDVPAAVLHYDMRSNNSSTEPVLLMVASPQGATGFGTLARHFTDRTVVTYDPRGSERSERTDGATESTPEEHADDLHRLISVLAAGPVDIFASSGGAVNALVLVTDHPEQVRTLVAHEPPAAQVLPDRELVMTACRDVRETYRSSGFRPAMAKFIALTTHRGPLPADFADLPAPDPTDFGLPVEMTEPSPGNDPMFEQNLVASTHYQHDFDALRAASTQIVLAVGAESVGEIAHRAGVAVAERLGREPVIFPSHHDGFLGGEYGMTGEPDAFAATLRQVLSADVTPRRR